MRENVSVPCVVTVSGLPSGISCPLLNQCACAGGCSSASARLGPSVDVASACVRSEPRHGGPPSQPTSHTVTGTPVAVVVSLPSVPFSLRPHEATLPLLRSA